MDHCAQKKPCPRQEGLRDPPGSGLGTHPEVKPMTSGSLTAACGHSNKSGWAGCRRGMMLVGELDPGHKAHQEWGMKGRIRGELRGLLWTTLLVEPLKVRDGWKMCLKG